MKREHAPSRLRLLETIHMTKMFKTMAAADKAMSIQPATTPAFDAICLGRFETCRSIK